jgi:ATP-dependent DNA helicase RecQ
MTQVSANIFDVRPDGVTFPVEVMEACARLGWPSGPRAQQWSVIEPVLRGEDVLAVLPTSAGKSATYQIPALVREGKGLVVVISPLVALMIDQVARLTRHGVRAAALTSHATTQEKRQIQDDLKARKLDLLYVSPERLQGMDPEQTGPVSLFAVDEAHCISEWGHDFRPVYTQIGRLLERWKEKQVLALTATANAQVVDEIAKFLRIPSARRIRYSADRPNIRYLVCGANATLQMMIQRGGLPCLVYGSTRKSVEDAAHELTRTGFEGKVAHYHAGMSKVERSTVQGRFIAGDLDIVVATCAFGMGIDHPGIRSVVHLEMPTSLEAYVQESGRAGRDGSPSLSLVRATVTTLKTAAETVVKTWPEPARVKTFWRECQFLFDGKPGKYEGEDRVQKTTTEITRLVNQYSGIALMDTPFDPVEVDACIRILAGEGLLDHVPYRERHVEVVLLEASKDPKVVRGKRQRHVVEQLRAYSDVEGRVVGTVAFFTDVVGLDRAYADELGKLNVILAKLDEWEPCQVLTRKSHVAIPSLDEARILAIRHRSVQRVESAKNFLYTKGCRRSYLLDYFGDVSSSAPSSGCCDRCGRPS